MKIISRRGFLASAVVAGSGMAWGFLKPPAADADQVKTADDDPFDAWVHIQKDGSTEIVLNKSEMGQGVFTSLPMLIAEEAEIDWDRVSIRQGTRGTITGGSGSVRHNFVPYRQIGAIVRESMISAAAEEWRTPERECIAQKGLVVHRPSGRSIPYSSLIDRVRSRPLPDLKAVRLPQPANV